MQAIIPLKKVSRHDLASVGEKIHELSRLDTYDFDVPDGFCLTSDVYMRHMTPYVSRVRKIDQLTRRTLVLRAAQELRESMEDMVLWPDTAAALQAAVHDLSRGNTLVARPSVFYRGTGETAPVGKLQAFFNITKENVAEVVIQCWMALFSEEIVLQKLRLNVEGEDVEMAVLIQENAGGICMGKIYTAGPYNNDNSIMVVQAGYAGEHRSLFHDDYEEEYIVHKEKFTIQSAKADTRLNRLIEDEQIIQLARIGLEVQEIFAQDRVLEWALEQSGRIWLLQSGPISGWYPAFSEEKARRGKRKKEKLYAYLGGLLGADDVFFEMGRSILDAVSPVKIYYFGGRPYAELSKHVTGTGYWGECVLGVLAAYDWRMAEELRMMAQTAFQASQKQRKKQPELGRLLECLLLEVKLKREIKCSRFDEAFDLARQKAERFLRQAEERIASHAHCYDQIKEAQAVLSEAFEAIIKELLLLLCIGVGSLARLREECDKEGIDAEKTSALLGAAAQGAQDETFTALEMIFELFCEKREEKGLDAVFDRNQEQNVFACHSGEEIANYTKERCGDEIASALAQFFDAWGFWGFSLMDIRGDSWIEKPSVIFEAIRENLSSQNRREGCQNAREAAADLITLMPKKYEKLIVNIHSILAVSTLPIWIGARLVSLVKPVILAVGEDLEKNQKLLYDSRDIVYLRLDELVDAEKREQLTPEIILRRKRENRQNRRLIPPKTMLANGLIPEELHRQDRMMNRQIQWQYLQGKGTAPGQAEGIARVIRDMNRIRLTPGEILVIPSMQMGFAPLVMQAGGIVSERGGELGYSNILCIERGIPAVAGVTGCTDTICSGDVIRIDGRSGVVVKL